MADVSALPVQDWGNMMTSFGKGIADQQQTQAQTGLIQQQTQTAGMQNQLMRARMPLIMHALQDFNTSQNGGSDASGEGAAPAGGSDSSGATAPDASKNWYDPARVDAGLRQRFFVNPAGSPQEMQSIVRAGVIGDPGLLEAAKAQREIGVAQRLGQNQSDANGLYESMSSVASAPEGSAIDALSAISPQAAAQIRKLIPDNVEEDAAARQYASHVASTVHQYSGREVVPDTGGTFRDKTTGEPVTGVPNASMNQEQWTNLANHEQELIPVKNSDGSESQIPRWQAEHNQSLQQAIMRAAAKGQLPGASPTVSGAPRQQAQAAASTAAKTAPPAQPQSPQQSPQQPPPAAGGPLSIALGDKSFRMQTPPTVQGTSQNLEQQETVKQTVKQRGELNEAASENAQAAAQALASFKAAKAIMEAPDGSKLGGVLPGAIYQELARLGFNTDTGAHRIEAAKYLTNGALQNLKTVYGAKPGVFDVKVNLEQAFPNVKEMNDASIKDLIDTNIRNSQYIRDSASRIPMYLQAGNRPTDFNTWNEKYFPRAETVNTGHTAESQTYKTPADVKAAYAANKITREQATQILKTQHGMQ